jgi:hypothetical protein
MTKSTSSRRLSERLEQAGMPADMAAARAWDRAYESPAGSSFIINLERLIHDRKLTAEEVELLTEVIDSAFAMGRIHDGRPTAPAAI